MKNLMLLGILFLWSCVLMAQPKISFDYEQIDMGALSQGENGVMVFSFTNTGNQPLVISNFQSSCGCLAPRYFPREPIFPNQRSAFVAVYDTKRIGAFWKTLTVTSNDSLRPSISLAIKGKVERKPELTDLGFIKYGTELKFKKEYLSSYKNKDTIVWINQTDPNLKVKVQAKKIQNFMTDNWISYTTTNIIKPNIDDSSYQIKTINLQGQYDTVNYSLGYRVFKSDIDVKYNGFGKWHITNQSTEKIKIVDVKLLLNCCSRKYLELGNNLNSLDTIVEIVSKQYKNLKIDIANNTFHKSKIEQWNSYNNPNQYFKYMVIKYKKSGSTITYKHYLRLVE